MDATRARAPFYTRRWPWLAALILVRGDTRESRRDSAAGEHGTQLRGATAAAVKEVDVHEALHLNGVILLSGSGFASALLARCVRRGAGGHPPPECRTSFPRPPRRHMLSPWPP